MLAALEAVEKMPIPAPRPEAVESMKKMRNHQMPTPSVGRLKPPAELVFHEDKTGRTAGTMVGAGGCGQAGSSATTAVGHGGNGSPPFDRRRDTAVRRHTTEDLLKT